MTRLRGTAFVFGVHERRIITNLPPGSRCRVRMRRGEFARVWVKTAHGIESWYIIDTKEGWQLQARLGANFREIREVMKGSPQ